MRAYGLPRESNFKYPDSFDVAMYGLKSRAGTYRATTSKQATRRSWARKARLEGRNACLEALEAMREEAREEVRELAREQEAREEYEREMLAREYERDMMLIHEEILNEDAESYAITGKDSFSAKMREKREEREYSRNLRDCWEYDIMMDNYRYHSEPIRRFVPAMPQPGMTLSQLLASKRAA